MADKLTGRQLLSRTGDDIVRVLISSYFMASALKLVPGTSALPLTAAILPENMAEIAATTLVFTLAFLVLLGGALRFTAIILALTIFWSSYMTMMAGRHGVGDFWRDLALIGGLILTYADRDPAIRRARGPIRRRIMPRRIRPASALILQFRRKPAVRRPRKAEVETAENLFADTPQARAS